MRYQSGPRRVRGRLRRAHSAPQARHRPVLGDVFQMIAEIETTRGGVVQTKRDVSGARLDLVKVSRSTLCRSSGLFSPAFSGSVGTGRFSPLLYLRAWARCSTAPGDGRIMQRNFGGKSLSTTRSHYLSYSHSARSSPTMEVKQKINTSSSLGTFNFHALASVLCVTKRRRIAAPCEDDERTTVAESSYASTLIREIHSHFVCDPSESVKRQDLHGHAVKSIRSVESRKITYCLTLNVSDV